MLEKSTYLFVFDILHDFLSRISNTKYFFLMCFFRLEFRFKELVILIMLSVITSLS